MHLTAPGIQIFKRAGVFEDVRRAGFLPKDWTYRKIDGTPIVTVEDIAVSKSPEATIVLPLGTLGEVLLPHVEKNRKISLKWGHRVVNTGQDENSAWAIVKGQDGSEKKIRGDFLCGCDGGTSQVRKSLFGEKNFPGTTWDVQFVATDVSTKFEECLLPKPECCLGILPLRQIWLRRCKCHCTPTRRPSGRPPHQRWIMARCVPRRQEDDITRSARQSTGPLRANSPRPSQTGRLYAHQHQSIQAASALRREIPCWSHLPSRRRRTSLQPLGRPGSDRRICRRDGLGRVFGRHRDGASGRWDLGQVRWSATLDLFYRYQSHFDGELPSNLEFGFRRRDRERPFYCHVRCGEEGCQGEGENGQGTENLFVLLISFFPINHTCSEFYFSIFFSRQ